VLAAADVKNKISGMFHQYLKVRSVTNKSAEE